MPGRMRFFRRVDDPGEVATASSRANGVWKRCAPRATLSHPPKGLLYTGNRPQFVACRCGKAEFLGWQKGRSSWTAYWRCDKCGVVDGMHIQGDTYFSVKYTPNSKTAVLDYPPTVAANH